MDAPKDVGGDEFHRDAHGGRERELETRRRRRRMAKMEGRLVDQGGEAELELQTKEADFKRVAEVDCETTGEMIGLTEELKNEIRAEVVKANARGTGAQRCRSSSEDECLEAIV